MICRCLGKYIGLEVPRPVLKLDEARYADRIQEILESNAVLKKKSTPIEAGNEIVMRLCCYDAQDRPLPDMPEEISNTVVGRGEWPAELEQALIGRRAGEAFSLSLVLPPRHRVHAGEPVRFEIEVLGAYDRRLPELTDAFVAQLDIDGLSTAAQLEQFTRAYVLEGQRREIDDALRYTVMRQVIENSVFELPEQELSEKVMELAADYSAKLLGEGVTLDDHLRRLGMTYEAYLDGLREEAADTLKYSSVIDIIGDVEHLTASDEETLWEIGKAAEGFDLSAEEFILACPTGYEGLKKDVLKKKVVDFIVGKVAFLEDR